MRMAREAEILLTARTIAVVGLSKDPSKESHSVSEYMMNHGYKIIPVNPTAEEILGQRSYPSLLEIPASKARAIDIVDIFRPSDQVPPIVDQAAHLRRKYGKNPKMVWMQEGIENQAAADVAKKSGMFVVQNLCVRTEHRRLAYTRRGSV